MKEKYKQYYIGQIITLKASPDKQLQDKIERTGYIKNIDDAVNYLWILLVLL